MYGVTKNSKAKLHTNKKLNWTNDPIEVLGVIIDHSDTQMLELNSGDMKDKISSILESWRNRGLTLMGKVIMLNSLIGSLFVYKMNVLRTIPKSHMDSLNECLRKYPWDDGTAKVALDILTASKSQAGLKPFDIKKKDQSLKIQ